MDISCMNLKEMTSEQLDISSNRLGRRIGLFNDYATVLLVANNWDEDYVYRQWNIPGNSLTSFVNVDCSFIQRIVNCHRCSLFKTCSTYGCQHLLCGDCVKGYVEENISAGVLNIKCPLDQCEIMMCQSAFLAEVSLLLRKRYKQNLLRSFNFAHPNASLISSGVEAFVSKKWFLLVVLILVGLYFRGTKCKLAFELEF